MSSHCSVYHGGKFEQLKCPTVGVKAVAHREDGKSGLGPSIRQERQGWGQNLRQHSLPGACLAFRQSREPVPP